MTMWVIPEDLGNFSPKKEKNLGEQKFARLSVSNFHGGIKTFSLFTFSVLPSVGFTETMESVLRPYF